MDILNSDLLRTFLAVVETGSITAAADRVSRSQSAASLQIGKLETSLGQRLFERHGRGVVLTQAGERLLPVARDVTGLLDATQREMTADGLSGTLRLGVPDDQSKKNTLADHRAIRAFPPAGRTGGDLRSGHCVCRNA